MANSRNKEHYQNKSDKDFIQMIGIDPASGKDSSARFMYTGTPTGGHIQRINPTDTKKGA